MKRIILTLFFVATIASASVPVGVGFWKTQPLGPDFPNDTVESYTDNVALNALNGGGHWDAAYVDFSSPLGVQTSDYFEDYTDAAALNALNLGNGWYGAYVDALSPLGLKSTDTIESYTDTAALNTLNAGSDWGGAFVAN